ncbi:MAG: glycosyltransferase family 2 protein, partial [Betaproteobacteria bacterium]
MKISVVTAVFNRVETVARAIQSVQRQDYSNVEHVVQDGRSTDGTMAVVEALATRATSVVSAPDAGIYDALNKGVARAAGDVIGLMHSDDFFAHDGVLTRVADALDRTGADGAYCDLQYVSASDPTQVVRHWRSGAYSPARLKFGWMPPHPTLYLRREVFERWGAYDTSLRISADYEAMLRYLLAGGISLAYVPEVLVKMRVGGESNGSLSRILLKSREDLAAIRRHNL